MSGNSVILSQIDGAFQYSGAYKDVVFMIWYKNGRPGRRNLYNLIPDTDDGAKPHEMTLQRWIDDPEWKEKADALDREVARRLEERMVTEKMQMLEEHADLGVEIRNIGLDYIKTHMDELTAHAAVRLVVEGVRIERDSRGVSNLLEELSSMSDEKLLDKLQKTLEGKEFDIEQLEAELDADS